MKRHLLILLGTARMLIAASFIAVKAVAQYLQPRTAHASSNQLISQIMGSEVIHRNAVSISTLPPPSVAYPLIQQVDGVKMQLLGTVIVGDYFTADICYDFPTNDPEWMIGGMSPEYITLSNGRETIPVYSVGMIGDLKTDANGNYTGRCDHLKFPVLPSTSLENLQIVVSRIATPPSEAPDCEKAQKRLDNAHQNIKIKCTQSAGLGGFIVTSKPAEMDNHTANSIASDAFLDIVQGPWIFDLNSK